METESADGLHMSTDVYQPSHCLGCRQPLTHRGLVLKDTAPFRAPSPCQIAAALQTPKNVRAQRVYQELTFPACQSCLLCLRFSRPQVRQKTVRPKLNTAPALIRGVWCTIFRVRDGISPS